MLKREGIHDIALIDHSDEHYYQPLWTLVGAGLKDVFDSVMPMGRMIHKNAKWIKNTVTKIDPENNKIVLENGDEVSYDYLVVSAGIQLDWHKIAGAKEAIEKKNSGVVSIYGFDHAADTWTQIRRFNGGRAIFTMPSTPIKCTSIMYHLSMRVIMGCCRCRSSTKNHVVV